MDGPINTLQTVLGRFLNQLQWCGFLWKPSQTTTVVFWRFWQ